MLSLTSTRTGRQFQAQDGRVLVGSASFCDVAVPTSRTPATLIFARYDGGWLVHDLQSQGILRNGEPTGQPIHMSFPVENGDIWTIGSEALQVHLSDEPVHPGLSGSLNSQCQVVVTESNGRKATIEFTKPATVIGAALYCDMPYPDEPRLEPQHFLVVSANGVWYLHSLISGGGSDGWQGFFRIDHRDSFDVGQLKFVFRLPARQKPDSAQAKPDTPTAPFVGNRMPAESAGHPVPVAQVDTNPNQSLLTSQQFQSSRIDPEVRQAAQDVLNKIKSLRLRPDPFRNPFSEFAARIRVWSKLPAVEQRFHKNERIHAFDEIGRLVEQVPWDRTLLLTFVRMCDAAGLDTICFHALRQMAQKDPRDPVVMRSLARISRHLAQEEPTYYSRSIRYWRDVLSQCPEDSRAIEDTIRGIMAEETERRIRR